MIQKFRKSDRIESALLCGLVSGAVSGAGILVWWLPIAFAAFFWCMFRKYAFITSLGAAAVGFSLASYCSANYNEAANKISEKDYAFGSFVLCLKDARQCSVKNIGKPAMISAELVSYKLSGSRNRVSCSSNVMVKLPEGVNFSEYGTIISGRGSISSSGDPEFANYLKARNIVKCIYLTDASYVGRQKSFLAEILTLRDKISSRVLDKIDNDNSRNLAAALFFGMTGGLNNDRRSAYINTGTIHVFSVSGMHVAILAYFLFLIFRCAGMRTGYVLTLLFTGAYVLSTGASAPAIRAYFMLLLWCVSRMYFLWLTPFSVFCWAASILLVMNPLLVLDIGARYSVVITGVLIAASEKISRGSKAEQLRRKYFVPGGRIEKRIFISDMIYKLRPAFWICVAAFFGGLAISLYHNGQFLLFSIPVNLLLSPFMSLFYLLLGLAMAVPESAFLLSGAFQLLQWFCEHAARLSYNLPAAAPTTVGLWLYIVLLFIFMRCGGKMRVYSGVLLASLILRWILLPFAFAPEIWIYNSVRRPACILLADSSRNRAIVIDPSSSAASAEVVRRLRRLGITGIESVFFSRNSIYTARGVRTLIRRIPVAAFHLLAVKKYEKRKKFYDYLEDCGIEKHVKIKENHKKLKIISQKRFVALEYFKRCAKLKDVLVLKELSDGRKLEMKLQQYRRVTDFMPFDRRERIYRYELGK